MHVVLRGITIWTLHALVSCAPVTCRSTNDGLRFGVMFGTPSRGEPFGRHSRQIGERMWRQGGSSVRPQRTGMAAVAAAAIAAAEERMRRANVAATCSDCTLNHDPMELSDDHYPNILPAVTCSDWHWCKEYVYPVQVLKRNNNDSNPGPGKTNSPPDDGSLPEELVRNWRFVQINVTVACSCPN